MYRPLHGERGDDADGPRPGRRPGGRISSPSRVLWAEPGITKLDLAQSNSSRSGTPSSGRTGTARSRCSASRRGRRRGLLLEEPAEGRALTTSATSRSRTRAAGSTRSSWSTSRPSRLWAAQMNTVVFHPWASRAEDPDHPDQLRIDLDPQPGRTSATPCSVAHELRKVLAEVGLTAWIKTSGNRGLHVFAPPCVPSTSSSTCGTPVIAAARELERRLPDQVTTAWWKEERGQRVFVDFNQANRDRTMAGAYSPRRSRSQRLDADHRGGARLRRSGCVHGLRSVPERSVRGATCGRRCTPSRATSVRCSGGGTATSATA